MPPTSLVQVGCRRQLLLGCQQPCPCCDQAEQRQPLFSFVQPPVMGMGQAGVPASLSAMNGCHEPPGVSLLLVGAVCSKLEGLSRMGTLCTNPQKCMGSVRPGPITWCYSDRSC